MAARRPRAAGPFPLSPGTLTYGAAPPAQPVGASVSEARGQEESEGLLCAGRH